MKFLLMLAIIIYVLSPIDLIPDYFGPLGRIDEIALLIFAWYRLKHKPNKEQQESTQQKSSSESRAESNNEGKSPPSPYETLGVPTSATKQEIDKAYRALVAQYHPDKVEHLGPEFRAMAHEKMVQITAAYQKLSEKVST